MYVFSEKHVRLFTKTRVCFSSEKSHCTLNTVYLFPIQSLVQHLIFGNRSLKFL